MISTGIDPRRTGSVRSAIARRFDADCGRFNTIDLGMSPICGVENVLKLQRMVLQRVPQTTLSASKHRAVAFVDALKQCERSTCLHECRAVTTRLFPGKMT
jgi:hypothetical protein